MTHKLKKMMCLLAIVLLTACSPDTKPNDNETPPKPEKVNYVGANLLGYNHQYKNIAVNKFSVNGYYGRVGGFTCCIMLPEKWQPGMQVRVEWEIDPNPKAKLPPLGTDEFKTFMKKHKANYRQYSAIVEVPEYGDSCGLQVHFFACNQVKVTATCMGIEHPNHPFKALMNQQENQSCPQ